MTTRALPHIRARLARPLAVLPAKLLEIDTVLAAPLTVGDNRAPRSRAYYLAGTVGVVPIDGTLVKSAGGILAASGLTPYSRIAEGLEAAIADPAAKSILLHVDSAGGEVDGLLAVADKVFASRKKKPITALVDGLAASAAYVIASQANRIILADALCEVGSIGVIAQHVDQSGADEMEGLVYTTLSVGARKADGNPHAPLSDEARTRFMGMLQNAFNEIVARVARGRKMAAKAIAETEANTFQGKAAVSAGLADQITPIDNLMSDLNSNPKETGAMLQTLSAPQSSSSGEAPSAELARDIYERRAAERRARATGAGGVVPEQQTEEPSSLEDLAASVYATRAAKRQPSVPTQSDEG